MLIEKRNFLSGMNGDTDQKLLAEGEYLNLMNGRVAVTEFGRFGRIENSPGTTLISQSVYPPYGTNQCIGGCTDTENSWMLYFLYNTFNDHGIYCLDYSTPSTPVIYPVLYDSQTTDGLGFLKDYRIDRNCRVINGVLYWTDNNLQPRKVNIRAGINLNRTGTFPDAPQYEGGIDENIITVIRKPPNFFLSAEKTLEGSTIVNTNSITLFAGKFSAFYDFIDNERSVLTGYSQLVNYNFKADLYNAIDVSFSLEENIPQDVQKINICVQYGIDPNFFIIKTWDKDNTTDAAEIAAHNAGSSALNYRFYNNQLGIPLSNAYSVKPYDSVPLISKTLETVRNRLHLGNNTEGYDTPFITSLTASFTTQDSGTASDSQAYKLVWGGGANIRYAVHVTASPDQTGWYRVTADDTTPPPTSIAFASLTFIGYGVVNVFAYFIPGWPMTLAESFAYQYDMTVTGTSNPLINQTAYKSGSPYKLGVVFYDKWMRKSGVVINGQTYVTEGRNYTIGDYSVSLDWVLRNSNAVNEIPEWAEFYSVVRTKCLSTSYFLQVRSKNATSSMSYVTKDPDNQYVFGITAAYSTTLSGVGVDITNLTNFGMGYVFSEGDLIKIYISSTVYTLRIIAQDGRWLVCELQDLGTLNNSTDALFEIYTPYTESVNEAYYEVGDIYAINNPGESNRTYSVLGDSIRGDITLLSRGTAPDDYITENMSPNDTYWMNWYTDAGRPNFIDRIGQVEKPNNISYSNVYIPGTRSNGLSSFDALDEKNIPQESGAIQKLQVASKITEEGNVMLAICKQNVVSLYMGEVQLVGASANAFIASAPEVIGTMNVLKKNYGTTHPETVIERHGLVFAYDLLNGLIWQYSDNGLVEVSDYKMARFFKNYARDFLATNKANLDNINGFHHIPFGIDVFHKELLCTLPGIIYENYADVLPSYSGVVPDYATSIINRFDIYDQLAKTMSFSYEKNQWGCNYEYTAEFYDYLQNTTFAFKDGNVYTLNTNTSTWNTWFGTEYPVRICGTANINPSLLKDAANIAIESDVAPDFSVLMANYPNEQITDLEASDYTDQQGVFYREWLGDRLDPNQSGTADQKLYTGSQLTDKALFWMLEWNNSVYNELIYCNFVNLGWQESFGQKGIANPINK